MQAISYSELQEVLKSNGKVIVKLGTEWCGTCRQAEKVLAEEEANLKDFTILTMDIESNPDAVDAYELNEIPVIFCFKNGKEHSRWQDKDGDLRSWLKMIQW